MSPVRMPSISVNLLLEQLGPAFSEHTEEIMLHADRHIFPDNQIDFVYFPLGAVISMVYGQNQMEAAKIGLEGLAGCSVVLDAAEEVSPNIVILSGRAARMPVLRFREAIARDPFAARVIKRYLCDLVEQILQLAACAQCHTPKERTARWLIHAQNCVGHLDILSITQERLGQLLGVRRATINPVLNKLRDEGCVNYSRGKLRIVDGQRLAAAACQCARLN